MTPDSVHAGSKGRLLIADDEPQFRDAISQLLELEGYECESAPNSQVCQELLAQKHFDVLIADIRMPGNTDLELLEQIQGLHLPVIVVTGYPSVPSAIRAIKLPVVAYLVKPFNFSELLREVERAIKGEWPAFNKSLPPEPNSVRASSTALTDEERDDPLMHHILRNNPEVGNEELKDVRELSKREREVLLTVLRRGPVHDVAGELNISPHTVRNHLKAIHRKLGVRSRAELLIRFGPVRDVPARDNSARDNPTRDLPARDNPTRDNH
jgi:DNA-binding NarL/FixJ family response regulator